MARDPAASIAAYKRGERPPRGVSHRFIGGNYLLTNPALPDNLVTELRAGSPTGVNHLFRRDEYAKELGTTHQQVLGLLKSAADLKVDVLPNAPDRLGVAVVVHNTGAGHALPTGPLDQRHMWLEVQVTDAQGRTLLHSGRFDDKTGQVAQDAVMWVKHMDNDAGQRDLRHTLFDVERLGYPRKPIPAGSSQRVDYTVKLPKAARGPFQVKAQLHYRIAFQEILDNIKEEDMGDYSHIIIPPVTIAQASAVSSAIVPQAMAIASKERP